MLEQLEAREQQAQQDFLTAKKALMELLDVFIEDLSANLKTYSLQNVVRTILRTPDKLQTFHKKDLQIFKNEINRILEEEVIKIIADLKSDTEWYDATTVYIDYNSKIWKKLKSIETPVNKVMHRFYFPSIVIRHWTWISNSVDEIINSKYPKIKTNFLEKIKELQYIQSLLAIQRKEDETKKLLIK